MKPGSTVFLAGSTGMAGCAIMRHFLERFPGIEIKAVYNRMEPYVRAKGVEYIRADLTARGPWQALAAECDVAILAAAETGGILSDNRYGQVTDNLMMDALLLDTLGRAPLRQMVYLSSASVYQDKDGLIEEDDLDLNADPHSRYFGVGWAKRTAEKLCEFWSKLFEKSVSVLRCSNIYGPFDRFNPHRSNFIPALIRKAGDGNGLLDVLGSPAVERDVIFCDDLAEAVSAVIAAEEDGFKVFNVGSGKVLTVGDAAVCIANASGVDPKCIHYEETGPATVRRKILDIGRIVSATGWKPVTDASAGIRKTVAWWNENKTWWTK